MPNEVDQGCSQGPPQSIRRLHGGPDGGHQLVGHSCKASHSAAPEHPACMQNKGKAWMDMGY